VTLLRQPRGARPWSVAAARTSVTCASLRATAAAAGSGAATQVAHAAHDLLKGSVTRVARCADAFYTRSFAYTRCALSLKIDGEA
jgi:hypothetical protein